MQTGKRIRALRALREERSIKPSDIERFTRSIASVKQNADFYVSHATLADIEAGSIPSIYKLFSLAACLKISFYELLLAFGIDPNELADATESRDRVPNGLPGARTGELPARLRAEFTSVFAAEETTLLRLQPRDFESLPWILQGRMDPLRFRYALIGSKDDSMGDLLPPHSLAEVDTLQNKVQVFSWRTLRERPIYLVWHNGGHACRWCQLDSKEIILLSHPSSQNPARRFKMPGEVVIVGRVTNAWIPFQAGQFDHENTV
jgi:transcriptional regulator with XRE-family HTH domain